MLKQNLKNSGKHHAPGFIRQFFRDPTAVGAIAPSSPALAEMITSWVNLAEAGVVVEFGPGTGAFTQAIKRKISPEASFIAVELNPVFVNILRQKFPDLNIYQDCVENTHKHLKAHGHEQCDCIISGLPWASFDNQLQERLLNAVYNILKPGGQFVTFAYLQGLLLKNGRRFRKRLNQRFHHLSTSPVVWPNLPPAFVYQAVKHKEE